MSKKPGRPKARRAPTPNTTQTLCWKCQNAVPSRDGKRGCSWSRKGNIPVEGWTAEPTEKIETGGRICRSFLVKNCPEFIPDKKKEEGK